jgi:peptidoglycan hydrolase-like protein with peptidoglycan-binding domain
VIEIQNALITRGYLQGVASGVYDDATVAAMKRFQGAENIDVTGYPTAQALRRLGLTPGPDAKSPGNFE